MYVIWTQRGPISRKLHRRSLSEVQCEDESVALPCTRLRRSTVARSPYCTSSAHSMVGRSTASMHNLGMHRVNKCFQYVRAVPSLSHILTSLFLASFFLYFGKHHTRMLPQQQAKWTSGPSLPRLRPALTASTIPVAFTSRVENPK